MEEFQRDKVFLYYQQLLSTTALTSPVTVVEKSRRTGYSWAAAAVAVFISSPAENAQNTPLPFPICPPFVICNFSFLLFQMLLLYLFYILIIFLLYCFVNAFKLTSPFFRYILYLQFK